MACINKPRDGVWVKGTQRQVDPYSPLACQSAIADELQVLEESLSQKNEVEWNRERHRPLASRYMCMCIYMYIHTNMRNLDLRLASNSSPYASPSWVLDYRCMLPCLASAYSLILLISSAWSAFLWICLPTKYVTSGVLSSVLFLLYIHPCWDSQPHTAPWWKASKSISLPQNGIVCVRDHSRQLYMGCLWML